MDALWSRWIDYTSESDLTLTEQPYKNNLVQLQVGDEQDIVNDSGVRAATTAWFNNNRSKFPSAILSINRPAGDGSASEATSTANWIAEAQPDMISFDWYPFTYNPTFDPNFPNRKWNWYWYSVAQRYRRQALGSYISATFGTAGKPAADALLKVAGNPKEKKGLRVDTVRAFGSALGPGLRGRAKDLIALLDRDPDFEVRIAIVEEFAALGNEIKDDKETIAALRRRMSDPQVKVREAAAQAIDRINKPPKKPADKPPEKKP